MRRVQLSRGNNEPFPHSTVGMNAQDFQIFTTIASALLAGKTVWIIDVGLDATAVANFDVIAAFPQLKHFNSKLVAGNSGVTVKWEFAEIATNIRTADSHAMDGY
jgi:SAM-dependent MidA family methyltransferase